MAKGKSQEEEFAERIESEARSTQTITNDDLVCRDCQYAWVNVDKCEMFLERKPNHIFYGGDCEEKEETEV